MTTESDKYNAFLDGYKKLCEETNYCFAITALNELSIFYYSSNKDEVDEQIYEWRGGEQ